ncbi:hypothetical protein [Microvirga antarctica]|uniref:hypothetical protein n=1 Tax=Microvirga antarctica TaxID=2819233 RepID=UPI001B313683|nr:hypothetical protein [Microvirga antarctica]
MTIRTTYLVQTFEIHRKRLVPTIRTAVKTEQQAERMAQSAAERKSGAAAIEISADDETGEVSHIRIISTFGEVPEDFAELLQNA